MGNNAVHQTVIAPPALKVVAPGNSGIQSPDTLKQNAPQKIISGKSRILVRIRIRATIVLIIFREYRNILKAFRLLWKLDKFRKSALGESRVMKYAHVDGKYYMGLYVPGFKTAAFKDFILAEVNRFVPLLKPTNRFTNVLFAITRKCALRCEHCSEWQTLNMDEKLSAGDLKAIVAKFREVGVAQIHFSGGEPLQRIDDLLEVLQTLDERTETWVLTSGNNLTLENARRLKSAGLTGVVVSIDHFDPEVHNQFRGSPKSFTWAQQAVKNAIEVKLVTAISICVTRSFVNDKNLFAYAGMAKNLGVSYIQIFEPKAVGHYQDKDVELTREQQEILEQFFFKMNNLKAYLDYPIVLYHGYYQRRIGCFSSANRHLYVDSQGDIYDCPFCRNTKGNILTGNFADITGQLRTAGCSKFKTIDF